VIAGAQPAEKRLTPAPFPRALVLAAGLGTRLSPLTLARAKAAVPVDGEPLASRVARWLATSGIRDLVLNLHHKPDSITRTIGDGASLGVRVRYSWESPVLGSAGGPRHALPLLVDGLDPAPALLLVNGDTLTDVSLADLAEHHTHSGALVTMALIPNPRPDKYGGVVVSEDGAVTGFTKRGSGVESFHFIGVQAVEARVFAPLEDGVFAESVLGLYPEMMVRSPGCVRGFVSRARFHDIGTPADLLETSLALALAERGGDSPRHGERVRIDPSARVQRSLLWDDVTVGPGAMLRECIVADGVTIAAGETFERQAIVMDGDRRVVEQI
jgi:NDP-sugar pyrophosphorylase family protein